jgi:hypothetical protein
MLQIDWTMGVKTVNINQSNQIITWIFINSCCNKITRTVNNSFINKAGGYVHSFILDQVPQSLCFSVFVQNYKSVSIIIRRTGFS